jgi:hypothetical protein
MAETMRRLFGFLSVGILMTSASSPVAAKTNETVVVMKNGDRMTGELKRLENGFLYFKADYMADTVQLDWKRVERLESKDTFSVVLSNGTRETGVIHKSPEATEAAQGFLVQSAGVSSSARNNDVVVITPVQDAFLHQLTGSINYGFSFTGGSNSTQSNFSGDATYRSERWAGKLEGSSVFNRQNGATNSGRNTVDAYYYNYRGEDWFIAGTAGFLTSFQQDLSARTTLGAGLGMDVVRGSTQSLQLIGGALFYNETYSPASGGRSGRGSDAQLLMQYTKYAFTKFQLTVQAGAFPTLTTPLGRVRLSIESTLKRDLGKNVTVLFSVYENYDSRPPVQAGKNDFGTSTSIGWTF